MAKKIKVFLLILSLAFTLSYMSNTYSRYVADSTGNVQMMFTKWQILVNDSDIVNETVSSIELTPVIDKNDNIAKDTIAPTSSGYFDITINPENVGVSFDYKITLDVLNENLPDIMITSYSKLDSNYVEGVTSLDILPITYNVITETLYFENPDENSENTEFKHEPFTIRVYFEWYEGTNEVMDDAADTEIGASGDDETLDIKATVHFKQNVSEREY